MTEFELPENWETEMRELSRKGLLERGIPEETVDKLLDLAVEYGKHAEAAVRDFERRGGEVVYSTMARTAKGNIVFPPWEDVDEHGKQRYIEVFSDVVDFIDEETGDGYDDDDRDTYSA